MEKSSLSAIPPGIPSDLARLLFRLPDGSPDLLRHPGIRLAAPRTTEGARFRQHVMIRALPAWPEVSALAKPRQKMKPSLEATPVHGYPALATGRAGFGYGGRLRVFSSRLRSSSLALGVGIGECDGILLQIISRNRTATTRTPSRVL